MGPSRVDNFIILLNGKPDTNSCGRTCGDNWCNQFKTSSSVVLKCTISTTTSYKRLRYLWLRSTSVVQSSWYVGIPYNQFITALEKVLGDSNINTRGNCIGVYPEDKTRDLWIRSPVTWPLDKVITTIRRLLLAYVDTATIFPHQ
ncbi:hypothetical protein TNCV_1248031 [Trichonephila clavipes]|nr:hypothetical protein TNCV_1248031 [Trichonephila clavipes]